MATVWLLNDLAEYRGKQELFTKQSPQKLARLRENAIIESAVASNRIEGVEIDRRRVGTVVFGKGILHDRNEQEVRGYQIALAWIHAETDRLPLTVPTVLRLHSLSHPEVSLDMIRKVLKDMSLAKIVKSLGRGKHAKWQRIG